MVAWRYEIYLLVLNIFRHSKINFVSPRDHVISSISLSKNDISLSENDISLSENNISLSENDISLNGNDISQHENDISPKNKTIAVTIYRSIYRLRLISVKYRR